MAPGMTEAPAKNKSIKSAALCRRFGRHQFPVGIARAHIAFEGPHFGDFANLLGIALDDLSVLVAGRRDELAYKAHREAGLAPPQVRGQNIGLVDADEFLLERL